MYPCLKYACSETLKRLPTPKLTCHSRFGANLKSASSAHRGGTKSDWIRLHPPRFVLGAPISSPALPFRLSQVTMSQPTGERDLKLGGERGRIGYASARDRAKPEVPTYPSLPLSLSLQRAREERRTERMGRRTIQAFLVQINPADPCRRVGEFLRR